MSHSTTSGGGRTMGRARASSVSSPPAAERAAQGRGHVDARAARVGAEAAGAAEVERKAETTDLGFGVADLGGRHLLEIHRLQHLAVTDRHDGVELGSLFLRFGRLADGRHRFGDPALPRGGLGGRGRDLLAEHGEGGLLERDGRVAPEKGEGLVEDFLMLAACGEQGAEGRLDLATLADVDEAQGLGGHDGVRGADGQTGAAEQSDEMHDVERQASAGRALRDGDRLRRDHAAFTSSRMRAASAPRMRAMSSWYLSSTPSV